MRSKRRVFLKAAALAGLNASAGGWNHYAGAGGPWTGQSLPESIREYARSHVQRFNMSGHSAPKMDRVRVGIIGLGQRGPALARLVNRIEGVEIRALCDLLPERAEAVKLRLAGTSHKPDLYAGSENAWKELCESADVDLVMIATPWYMHAEQAVYAMERGKHAVAEVPAASTIEECWRLVATAERTRKHFMMLGNTSYMEFQLLTLNMARRGFFGEVVHGDCAYNTSKMKNNFSGNLYWDMWWLRQYASRKGNIYPTHGLGPVCQIMNINRGDRLDYLVSMESDDFMMRRRARELAEKDEFFEPFARKEYRGNMNVTVIRTKRGRTIMLQHDATTPSPHNLIHGIHGTMGAAMYEPPPPRLSVGNHEWVSPREFESLKQKYTPEITRRMGELARDSGHGGSDLLMVWHLMDCLRNGLPPAQDVYDAASWSSIVPLSEWSVLNRSNSIEIPDFTAGAWRTNEMNMDIHLERGGTVPLKG